MVALPLVPPKQVASTTESMVKSNVFGSLTVYTSCIVQFVTVFFFFFFYSPTVNPGKIPDEFVIIGAPLKGNGLSEYSKSLNGIVFGVTET